VEKTTASYHIHDAVTSALLYSPLTLRVLYGSLSQNSLIKGHMVPFIMHAQQQADFQKSRYCAAGSVLVRMARAWSCTMGNKEAGLPMLSFNCWSDYFNS
jgi:hypothetical protein